MRWRCSPTRPGGRSRAGLDPADIDGVVAVSTTGITTPSLDALIIEQLGLRPDVQRLPVFGLGCAGGVIGLSHAATMAQAISGRVLFLVVELCALTFRFGDNSQSNIVAAALFGDGAAAAVIGIEGEGPRIGAAGLHTWPRSLDVMGWRVEEDGLGVLFSRDIPTLVRTAYRSGARRLPARGSASARRLRRDDLPSRRRPR
jgi:alkylresorcinol/alkylpyrone synthase